MGKDFGAVTFVDRAGKFVFLGVDKACCLAAYSSRREDNGHISKYDQMITSRVQPRVTGDQSRPGFDVIIKEQHHVEARFMNSSPHCECLARVLLIDRVNSWLGARPVVEKLERAIARTVNYNDDLPRCRIVEEWRNDLSQRLPSVECRDHDTDERKTHFHTPSRFELDRLRNIWPAFP